MDSGRGVPDCQLLDEDLVLMSSSGAQYGLRASPVSLQVFHNHDQDDKFGFAVGGAWVKDSLPWFGQGFDETRALMGDNYYSYGIENNQKTLDALFRDSHEQGLCSRQLTIEELFEPTGLKLVDSPA
jgi:hypothetical protein